MIEQMELDLGNVSSSIEVLPFGPRQIRILNEQGIKTIDSLIDAANNDDWSEGCLIVYLCKFKYFGRCVVRSVLNTLDDMGIKYGVGDKLTKVKLIHGPQNMNYLYNEKGEMI